MSFNHQFLLLISWIKIRTRSVLVSFMSSLRTQNQFFNFLCRKGSHRTLRKAEKAVWVLIICSWNWELIIDSSSITLCQRLHHFETAHWTPTHIYLYTHSWIYTYNPKCLYTKSKPMLANGLNQIMWGIFKHLSHFLVLKNSEHHSTNNDWLLASGRE